MIVGASERGLLAGALDVTTRTELEDEHPTDSYELFNKTPGVSLSRYGQGIINTDLSIRGFAGDGVTPHAKLLIDGIPSHLHNGYGELDQLFPLAIERIEVFKGTSDPRYGRFNTAGNYYITTRTDEANEVQATYGDFNTLELQAYSGHKAGRLTQNLFAGYRQTEGYRDHANIDKFSVSGRWALDVNDSGNLAFVARLSGYEGNSPGYLSKTEARRAPRSSAAFANQDGGNKEVQHFALHYDQWLEEQFHLSIKGYRQNFERQRWVRFSESGDLTERFDDQTQTGMVTVFEWLPSETWALQLGLDVQSEDVLEQRFGTVGQARLRDASNVGRNLSYDLTNYGGFVSVENTLLDRVHWGLGLRGDAFGGDFTRTDAMGEQTAADIMAFGLILQPKANLLVDIVGGLAGFGNYGRTFQSPYGATLYDEEGAGRSDEVSVNDGWEAGVKYDSDFGLNARVSVWQQLASNEYVSVDGTDRNIGKTSRTGVEIAARWTPIDPLLLWGNAGWTRTRMTDPGNAVAGIKGNELRSIPVFTTSFGARWDVVRNVFVAVHFDGQGKYYVNESNVGGKFGNYLLAHADAGWEDEHNRIQLQVNNLFDSYYEYVYDFSEDGTSTIHAPGNGLNANLAYTRTF